MNNSFFTVRPIFMTICSLCLAGHVSAARSVALDRLDHDMTGPRTQVLVLGTVHLSELPAGFSPAKPDPLIANIAETFREQPGARVLSVVGVSHKPWFDHWLGQLQGVEIVAADDLLK